MWNKQALPIQVTARVLHILLIFSTVICGKYQLLVLNKDTACENSLAIEGAISYS